MLPFPFFLLIVDRSYPTKQMPVQKVKHNRKAKNCLGWCSTQHSTQILCSLSFKVHGEKVSETLTPTNGQTSFLKQYLNIFHPVIFEAQISS